MLIHFDTLWIHLDTVWKHIDTLWFIDGFDLIDEAIFQSPLHFAVGGTGENEPPARRLYRHG